MSHIMLMTMFILMPHLMMLLLVQRTRMPLVRYHTVFIRQILTITLSVLGHTMLVVRHILHSNLHKIDIILNFSSSYQ